MTKEGPSLLPNPRHGIWIRSWTTHPPQGPSSKGLASRMIHADFHFSGLSWTSPVPILYSQSPPFPPATKGPATEGRKDSNQHSGAKQVSQQAARELARSNLQASPALSLSPRVPSSLPPHASQTTSFTDTSLSRYCTERLTSPPPDAAGRCCGASVGMASPQRACTVSVGAPRHGSGTGDQRR